MRNLSKLRAIHYLMNNNLLEMRSSLLSITSRSIVDHSTRLNGDLQIKISRYTPANLKYALREEVVDLLANSFTALEPMSKALKLQPLESRKTFEFFMEQKELKILVAHKIKESTHNKNDDFENEVVGASIGLDLNDYLQMDFNSLPKCVDPIGKLLSGLDEHLHKYTGIVSKGQFFHAASIAVDSRYINQGIGKALFYEGYTMAKDLKFRAVVSETTNIITQQMQKKLGSTVLYQINYKDFQFDGSYPFASITDTQGVQMIVHELKDWNPPQKNVSNQAI